MPMMNEIVTPPNATPLLEHMIDHQVLVEMRSGGIHHQVRDQHLIHLGHGLAAIMAQDLAFGEIFKVEMIR